MTAGERGYRDFLEKKADWFKKTWNDDTDFLDLPLYEQLRISGQEGLENLLTGAGHILNKAYKPVASAITLPSRRTKWLQGKSHVDKGKTYADMEPESFNDPGISDTAVTDFLTGVGENGFLNRMVFKPADSIVQGTWNGLKSIGKAGTELIGNISSSAAKPIASALSYKDNLRSYEARSKWIDENPELAKQYGISKGEKPTLWHDPWTYSHIDKIGPGIDSFGAPGTLSAIPEAAVTTGKGIARGAGRVGASALRGVADVSRYVSPWRQPTGWLNGMADTTDDMTREWLEADQNYANMDDANKQQFEQGVDAATGGIGALAAAGVGKVAPKAVGPARTAFRWISKPIEEIARVARAKPATISKLHKILTSIGGAGYGTSVLGNTLPKEFVEDLPPEIKAIPAAMSWLTPYAIPVVTGARALTRATTTGALDNPEETKTIAQRAADLIRTMVHNYRENTSGDKGFTTGGTHVGSNVADVVKEVAEDNNIDLDKAKADAGKVIKGGIDVAGDVANIANEELRNSESDFNKLNAEFKDMYDAPITDEDINKYAPAGMRDLTVDAIVLNPKLEHIIKIQRARDRSPEYRERFDALVAKKKKDLAGTAEDIKAKLPKIPEGLPNVGLPGGVVEQDKGNPPVPDFTPEELKALQEILKGRTPPWRLPPTVSAPPQLPIESINKIMEFLETVNGFTGQQPLYR